MYSSGQVFSFIHIDGPIMSLPPSSGPDRPQAEETEPQQSFIFPPVFFIFVKIPFDAALALRREEAIGCIDQALQENRLGSVQGWGNSVGPARRDGSRPIEFYRIDIDVTDLAPARTVLRHILSALGAPPCTEIHYKKDERSLLDVFRLSGWILEQPQAAPGTAHTG
jgi:hypothetical protein